LLGATAKAPLFHLPCTDELLSVFEATYELMSNVHAYGQLVAAGGALAHFLSMANLQRYSVNARSQTSEKNLEKTTQFMRENLGGPLFAAAIRAGGPHVPAPLLFLV